jgi:hypothetical protein
MDEKLNIKKYSKSKKFYCCVTEEIIPPSRVEYLLKENVPETQFTSINGAKHLHRPKKLIVVDDLGTEFICNHIDNTRAWEQERFGIVEVEENEATTETTKTKKLDETSILIGHESLESYIKKQDAGDEEEE